MLSTKLPKTQLHKWGFDGIGTAWSIETELLLDEEIKSSIAVLVEEYDRTYSRFRSDSLVTRIATDGAGDYDFPDGSTELFALYRSLYDMTGGAVSPLVGRLLADAGYDAAYSLRPGTISPVPKWDDVMTVRGNKVTANKSLLLDVGAAGKGQLIDSICTILDRHISEYVVDGSGDMRVRGKLQTIGLENPFDSSMVIGSVTLTDGSICASAVNRRAWKDWHHIVDPRVTLPVQDVVAAWAIAPLAMLADGLVTALFFVNSDAVRQRYGDDVQTVRLLADGTIEHSSNFVGELYI